MNQITKKKLKDKETNTFPFYLSNREGFTFHQEGSLSNHNVIPNHWRCLFTIKNNDKIVYSQVHDFAWILLHLARLHTLTEYKDTWQVIIEPYEDVIDAELKAEGK